MTEPELSKPPSPFQIPIFRAMWIASLVSNFGGLIQSVGASWLMTSLTPSPTLVALVQTSVTLPIMLLSLLSGAIADNAEQRSVMLCAQGFMLVVSAVLAIFAWNDMLTPMAAARFYLPARYRHRAGQSVLAGFGRRDGSPIRSCRPRSRSTAWDSTLPAVSARRSAAQSWRPPVRQPPSLSMRSAMLG